MAQLCFCFFADQSPIPWIPGGTSRGSPILSGTGLQGPLEHQDFCYLFTSFEPIQKLPMDHNASLFEVFSTEACHRICSGNMWSQCPLLSTPCFSSTCSIVFVLLVFNCFSSTYLRLHSVTSYYYCGLLCTSYSVLCSRIISDA